MSRRPASVVAAGALFSALVATSPRLSATNETRGQTRTGPQQENASGAQVKGAKLEVPEQFKAQAMTDYLEQLKKRFQDACVDGLTTRADGIAVTPAARTTSAGQAALTATAASSTTSSVSSDANQQVADQALVFGDTIRSTCNLEWHDFIIALVPDPVHTHLALDFDRLIEVIQEGTQDEGFQFVHADLPWSTKGRPEPDNIAARLNDDAYTNGRQGLPGLITFRGPNHKHLFVWLVEESPTGGIESMQFSRAMAWTTRGVAKEADRSAPLRILGPTFSGSLSSLAQLLENDKSLPQPTKLSFLIFSGSISNRSSIDGFVQQERQRKERFASFQETDYVLIERFKEYVAGHAYGTGEFHEDSIAILSEDETEYGGGGSGLHPECPRCSYLHFPREISRLRAAYQGIDARNGEVQAAPHTILPINLEISGADDDTVATFSKQSPLSQEGVLLGIVSELRKHAVQFIILRATDPIDVLFLSRYLGAAYPKARIVTMGADVLFSREIEDKQLHGILALSTYSVAPTANHEFLSHADGQSERLFPSSSEAGAYNALRALLETPKVDFSGDPPGDRIQLDAPNLHLYQYGWPEAQRDDRSGLDPNTPPVHLLALGHDGYWPIAHLGPFGGERGTTLPKVTTSQLRACPHLEVLVPISWIAAELIALLLAAAFSLTIWFSSVLSQSQFAASLSPAILDASALLVAGAALALAGILLLLLVPLLGGGDWDIPGRIFLAAILFVCLAAVLAAALCDLVSRVKLDGARARPTLGWVLCLVVLVAWWIASHSASDRFLTGAWRFEVLRSLQLTSGLSPILPMILLLAAWLWWTFQISSGIALLDDRRPQLPRNVRADRVLFVAEGAADLAKQGATHIAAELIEALKPCRASAGMYLGRYVVPGAVVAAGLLGLAAFSPRTPWPLMTLDAADYQRPLMILFWLATAGIVGTTLCLWDVWLKARRLLIMLDSLPLRRGFKALEGFSWQPLWRVGLASLTELQCIVAREREALTVASNMGDGSLQAAQVEVEQARELVVGKYRDVLAIPTPFLQGWHARRRSEKALTSEYKKLQSAVATAAGCALDQLAGAWLHEKEKPRRAGALEPENETSLRACERFVCLVYVSFLLVVLVRMRTLILAAGGMYVFVLLAMTSYPFQPRASIVAVLAILLLTVLGVVTLVFAQAHRNAILSNLTNTKPGELGADFWVRLTSFAALPVVTFFASQFPQLNRLLSSWLEPALQALNK